MVFLDDEVSVEPVVQGEINEALMQADMARTVNRAGGEVDWTKRRPITISVNGVTRIFDYYVSIDNRTNSELVVVRKGDWYVAFVEDIGGWKLIPALLEVTMPKEFDMVDPEDDAAQSFDEAEDWFASLDGTLALVDMFRSKM